VTLQFWVIGLLALLRLIPISAMNPQHLPYPCQQAASPIHVSRLVSTAASPARAQLCM